ncbi:MAG: major capsid protein [Arizlama microvirus]|nr:MAG: major capsid protein [Arizlama microvirus]
MLRNKTARQHNFATVPRADIPRSKFAMRQTRKMAFNASELVPIMCEEVLPGDTWQHSESIVARLATPIAPIIDDMDLETFYFFVPNRIIWPDWEDFITGKDTALSIPTVVPVDDTGVPFDAVMAGRVLDHFGLVPQAYTVTTAFNVLPLWGYLTIYNEWFRDQNLQDPWTWSDTWTVGETRDIDGGSAGLYNQQCLRINKRHDYFTSSLPWPQKGTAVEIPLGNSAPVFTDATTGDYVEVFSAQGSAVGRAIDTSGAAGIYAGAGVLAGNLFADLTNATAATINSLRLAFQTQKLLERDARGGSRYVEQLLSHFGVRSPDYRLQRPEYLGGSKIPVTVNPVAQTAAYDTTVGADESPIGNLGAEMHATGHKQSFTYAATEHGYIIGVCAVRATPTYQQGTRRHWRRQTRLDYYFPAFAMLGEQAVATEEIYQPANGAPAVATWGYQEHWAEYRYTPNEITGVLRSNNATPIDWWHLAEDFASEPTLQGTFIQDKTQETLARALATGSAQWAAQIIMDILHSSQVARLMPTYSVPGLIDHF